MEADPPGGAKQAEAVPAIQQAPAVVLTNLGDINYPYRDFKARDQACAHAAPVFAMSVKAGVDESRPRHL